MKYLKRFNESDKKDKNDILQDIQDLFYDINDEIYDGVNTGVKVIKIEQTDKNCKVNIKATIGFRYSKESIQSSLFGIDFLKPIIYDGFENDLLYAINTANSMNNLTSELEITFLARSGNIAKHIIKYKDLDNLSKFINKNKERLRLIKIFFCERISTLI